MSNLYILDEEGRPRRADLQTWGAWMQHADRNIAHTQIGTYHISTVFLGMDHGFGEQVLLYETMVWEAMPDGEHHWLDGCARYGDVEAARGGHQAVVVRLQLVLAEPLLPYNYELEEGESCPP